MIPADHKHDFEQVQIYRMDGKVSSRLVGNCTICGIPPYSLDQLSDRPSPYYIQEEP